MVTVYAHNRINGLALQLVRRPPGPYLAKIVSTPVAGIAVEMA